MIKIPLPIACVKISLAIFCVLNSALATNLKCNNGTCVYNDTSAESAQINDILKNKQENIKFLLINTPKATLTGEGKQNEKFSLGDEEKAYSFTINAQKVSITNDTANNKYNAKITASRPSNIRAHLDIQNTHLQVINYKKAGFDGSLRVEGDFNAKNSNIMKGIEGGTFLVLGKSDITDTNFIAYSLDALSNAESKVLMLTSNGGFNSNIISANTAQFKLRKDTTMLEEAWGFRFLDENSSERGSPIGNDDGVVDNIFKTTLKLEGKNLYLVKEIGNKSLRDLEIATIKMDLDVVNAEIAKFTQDKYSGLSATEQAKLKELQTIIQTKYNEAQNKSDEQIAKSYNKNGAQYGDIMLSAITADDKDAFGSLVASDLLFNKGNGAVKEILTSSAQIAESAQYSPNTFAINLQSDIATTARMAKFSNPHTKIYYAQNTMTTNKALYGDIYSDVPLMPYFAMSASDLLNNAWVNLFGGANIIGSNTSGVYGLNAGYDRRFGSHFVGGYLSYAYSAVHNSHLKQNIHNIQVGLYSRLVVNKNEFDVKWSAQAGITKQSRYALNSQNDASFTRAFMALSGNYGYVIEMGERVSLKPIVGINLYLNHTPKYSEKGTGAQKIEAMTNSNISLDVGLDLRAYWSEDSFFYFIPKFEQYILNENDDFVGAFVGSPNSFRIERQGKLKTYIQGILGVDVGIYNGLAITLNAGVKQLISKHINEQNETFVSGNLGVKYRF